VRVVQCQPVHVAFEEPDLLAGAILVAVPKQPLDALERLQQAQTGGFVMMDNTARVLFQHRHAHGDMEPVQHVFGRRGDLLGQRSDLLAAVGQEGDILIGLQTLAREHIEQPALWLAIVAVHQQGDVTQPPVADSVSPAQPVGEHERAAPEILIPAYVDLAGRDSLGRGLDPASIAAAVAKDRAVQQERGFSPPLTGVLRSLEIYVSGQSDLIIDYATARHSNEPISTATTESTVQWLLHRRMGANQQMRWSPRGAHLMLKVRTSVVNETFDEDHARAEQWARRPLRRAA